MTPAPIDALLFRLNEIALLAELRNNAQSLAFAVLLREALAKFESDIEDHHRAEVAEREALEREVPFA